MKRFKFLLLFINEAKGSWKLLLKAMDIGYGSLFHAENVVSLVMICLAITPVRERGGFKFKNTLNY